MAPRPKEKQTIADLSTGPLNEFDDITTDKIPQEAYQPDDRPAQIVWRNVAVFVALHLIALYGLYNCFTSAKWATVGYGFLMYHLGAFGITGGAHRLWSHKSYKAKWPLKLILVVCQTIAHQNSVIEWARDHRVHHKFQETDADPHNAKRGFFFSHMGWLLCKKHDEVKVKGKGVDMSDLYAEPLLRFQHKYFMMLMPLICFILPTIIPMVLWGETYLNAFSLNILRYICSLHGTWLVNSAAHMWGWRPYDKYISSVENRFVSFFAIGEGWHNFHHTFPWDYKAAEFGKINLTLSIINFFAKIGWAYELKTVSKDMIEKRVLRTGDGSHEIWGWGDKDQTEENYQSAVIYNKKDD
ncbi:acyl-CoA Delta-9 desaturase-like [Anthonomus grandis grandis]|uniref:acyl-CoA Delta-9 desaturase-like n=1 Tax=Anthonomus grandis grandis TaxID=2921223 RepID=UPI002165076B|nr:acyl-CoA Delta-9 desaturase-like [Anthonomus grandis grandis]XP_050306600.1 acyl-CoA Delta-9 desaturase-like [Anthonomus grandis grandis]